MKYLTVCVYKWKHSRNYYKIPPDTFLSGALLFLPAADVLSIFPPLSVLLVLGGPVDLLCSVLLCKPESKIARIYYTINSKFDTVFLLLKRSGVKHENVRNIRPK